MNILHIVESYYPSIGGMSEVVKQLSERLFIMGHAVTVATSVNSSRTTKQINGVDVIDFNLKGNNVEGIVGDKGVYENYLLNSNFDIVAFFAAQQWSFDIALPILQKIKGKKVLVPTGFSNLYRADYADYYKKMEAYLFDFDWLVFLSDAYRDIDFARKINYTTHSLIPNGAAEEEFDSTNLPDIRNKLSISKEEFLILHIGSYTGLKGHKEALKLFIHASAKNAVLLMVGNGNNQLSKYLKFHRSYFFLNLLRIIKRKKIILTELNRKETIAAYKQADLFLFPSNIECSPIVLFEAMAAGLPFLTSDVGNSKEIINWSEHAGDLLPTEIDNLGMSRIKIWASANKLDEIIENKEKLKSMTIAGKKNWNEKFTWQKIAKQYETLYLSLIR